MSRLYFADLRDETKALLVAHEFVPLPVPEAYARKECKGTLLEGHAYVLPGLGEYRFVHIASSRVAIYNLFHYPEDGVRAPVLAAEFVLFGEKPVVLVADIVGGSTKIPEMDLPGVRLINGLRNDLGGAKNSDDMPSWYQECRSGGDLFLRPEKEVFDAVRTHFPCFLDRFLHRYPSMATSPASSHVVQSYKHHHCINSPGLRLLGRTYGEEWTEQFLHEWFFA